MNRILIPLDGSKFSTQIIASVKKLFPAGACELVLYHVGSLAEGHTGLPPRPAAAVADVPMYDSDKEIEFAKTLLETYSPEEISDLILYTIDASTRTKFAIRSFGGVKVYLNTWLDEKATGPLMLQGDHGPVSFRNIIIRNALLD